jgi:hypothetical protein
MLSLKDLIKHLEVTRKLSESHSEVIWKLLGSQLELSRMQFSNFIWNTFRIHTEICSNTPNAHSKIPCVEVPRSTWNFRMNN